VTHQTLTPAELDELAALEAKAFCAPWVARSFEIECPCPNGQHCGDSHTCEEVNAPEEYPWSSDAPADPDAENAGQCIVQIDVPGLEDFAKANAALIAAMRNKLPALLSMARRLGDAEDMAREAEGHCDVLHQLANVREEVTALALEQLTAATARAEASDARAQAAEKRCGDLIDLVEDRLNYIDDRHVVKELRAALAAAKLGGG
jgi:hypothetical protein